MYVCDLCYRQDFKGYFQLVKTAVWSVFAYHSKEMNMSVVNHNLYCMFCHRACKHTLHVTQLIESENCPEILEELSRWLNLSETKSFKTISPVGISWKKNTIFAPTNSAEYFT